MMLSIYQQQQLTKIILDIEHYDELQQQQQQQQQQKKNHNTTLTKG